MWIFFSILQEEKNEKQDKRLYFFDMRIDIHRKPIWKETSDWKMYSWRYFLFSSAVVAAPDVCSILSSAVVIAAMAESFLFSIDIEPFHEYYLRRRQNEQKLGHCETEWGNIFLRTK